MRPVIARPVARLPGPGRHARLGLSETGRKVAPVAAAGLPANTPAKVWTPADWTTKAMEEPAKRAVIDALDGWAYDWYERIK